MRFAVAAALFLSSHGASANDKLANKQISRNNHRNKLRGKTQQVTQNGSLQRQLNKPTAKKLIRRLANRRKVQAIKSVSTNRGGSNKPLPENDAESVLPDLGIIGNQKHHHRRALKESLIDKNSIREPIREETYSVSNDEIETYSVSNDEIGDDIPIYSASLLDELQQLCNYCECDSFDFESVNGTVECTFSDSNGSDICQSTTNYCGETVEICYRESISFEGTSPENYSYTFCQTYTKPYQQHVCITFNHAEEYNDYYESINNTATLLDPSESGFVSFTTSSSFPCFVQFNDMECNSCSTEIRTTQQNYFNEETGEGKIISIFEERCFQIDCSNTGEESNIANTCDSAPIPTTLKDNVIFGDDCTRCQPCGLGYRVENQDAEGSFPLIGEYQCSGLELAAKVGFFGRELCPEVQAKTAEYCGCEPLFYDPTLVSVVTEETSRIDTSTKSDGTIVLLPGDTIGDASCNVCGSREAIVANPDAVVTLPNGVMTSCSALQGAGRLGMFSSTYCLSTVMPLVFRTCGGCYHDQELTVFDPESILQQPSIEVEEPEPEQEPELEQDKPINSSTPNFVVGEGIVSCHLCESGSELSFPDNVFTLSNEEISCRDFEKRLKNTALSEIFCLEEASAIADTNCGGCEPKQIERLIPVSNDSLGVLASRMDEPDQKPMHKENPEEVDVYSDPSVESNTSNATPNAAISANTSSSQSLIKASKTCMSITATLAISSLVYFS